MTKHKSGYGRHGGGELINRTDNPMAAKSSFSIVLKFAFRELRHSFNRFYIFITCLAIGAMMIAGIGAIAASLNNGINYQSQAILGGDISLKRSQRPISKQDLAILKRYGKVSETITQVAMARSGDRPGLIQIKTIDASYPLYGQLEFQPNNKTSAYTALSSAESSAGNLALVDNNFLARLGLRLGDDFTINNRVFKIKGIITSEPDLINDGVSLAPRVMVTKAGLATTGLIRPGSLTEYSYRLRLPANSTDKAKQISKVMLDELSDKASWRLRTRDKAALGLRNAIGWFSDFLTILSLSSLIAGGIGIANAVKTYLAQRRQVIAIYKSLGAKRSLIIAIFSVQITVLAVIGITVGVILSLGFPLIVMFFLAGAIPFAYQIAYPEQWIIAILASLIITFIFSIRPIIASGAIRANALFRATGSAYDHPTSPWVWLTIIATGTLLAATIALLSGKFQLTILYLGIMLATFVIVWLFALACKRLSLILPRSRRFAVRLALANVNRPGSPSTSIMLSIGLGLTLLVALSTIENNLYDRLVRNVPENTPLFFFIDIQKSQVATFNQIVKDNFPNAKIAITPLLRGRITRVKGINAEDYPAPAEAQLILGSNRGITFSETMPENSTIARGSWWPTNYQGTPLMSFEADLARKLNLKIGDTITVDILGRSITATIANLRNLKWESLSINFIMVLSPNTLRHFPYSYLASITVANANSGEQELQLIENINLKLPAITAIRVKEFLQSAAELITKLGWGLRGAALITLIVAIMVLASAIASSHNYHKYQAIILKTLGATRRYLITTYLIEYALLGTIAAVFAMIAGSIGAWVIVTMVLELNFVLYPSVVLIAAGSGLLLSLTFGLIDSWRILGAKPAKALRNL